MDKRICIITGAAGGLGRTVVERFLAGGEIVIGFDRGDNPFSRPNWSFHEVDVLSEGEVGNAFKSVVDLHGRVDVLVNLVGGIYPWSRVEEVTLDTWEKTVNLNLRSVFLNSREALRIMRKNGAGKIVNIGSQQGLKGASSAGPYGVSKAAVINLSQIIADEGKSANIQCNVIIPSIIDTPANRKSMPDADFSKWASPSEIAEVIYFAASAGASGMTGSIIQVPGRV